MNPDPASDEAAAGGESPGAPGDGPARRRAGGDAGRAADRAEALLGRMVATLGGRAEARPAQVAMARAVAEALAAGERLAVAAPTGTGKTLAYLAAAATSGQRVVVATSTKALQGQLAGADLPLVAATLREQGSDLAWSVVKGRSNYVCRAALADTLAKLEGVLEGTEALAPEVAEQVRRLASWAASDPDGDLGALDWEPDLAVRREVTVTAEECPGARRCPFGSVCFAELALTAGRNADLVVVNTALLGTDLVADGGVLSFPHRPFDGFVLDEAHAAEDTLAGILGCAVGPGRLQGAAIATRRNLGRSEPLADRIQRAAGRLGDALEPLAGKRLVDGPGAHPDLLAALGAAGQALQPAIAAADAAADAAERQGQSEAGTRARRAHTLLTALRRDLATAAGEPDAEAVWVEAKPLTLRRVPVGIVERLETAWGDRAVVATSATLPPGLAARLAVGSPPPPGVPASVPGGRSAGTSGMPPTGERNGAHLRLPSPFDYRTQALLVVPDLFDRKVPAAQRSPRHPAWEEAAWAAAARLIRAAGGRTLFLFTAQANLERWAERGRSLGFPVLVQGEAPKDELLARFRADPAACLYATMSFWVGVDVPGDACVLVIIDRLPFRPPDDPLFAARREAAGRWAFRDIDLPAAGALLAQGAGRLVRSRSDRGVVCVLDTRLAEKDYRTALLSELPPAPRTRDLTRAEVFLRGIVETSGADAGPSSGGGGASGAH